MRARAFPTGHRPPAGPPRVPLPASPASAPDGPEAAWRQPVGRLPPPCLPRRRRRRGRPAAAGRAGVAVLLDQRRRARSCVLITSLRGIAGFWTDYLWFDSLGQGGVFTGVLEAQATLVVLFTGDVLRPAVGQPPRRRPGGSRAFQRRGPEEEVVERYRELVGEPGRPGAGRHGGVLRAHRRAPAPSGPVARRGSCSPTPSTSAPETDPLFHRDIGFYVFQLPFLSFAVGWLFAALVIVLLVTVVAHYLNGGIRLQVPGPERVTPQVKVHLSVLLGLLALVRAVDYYLERFELTVSTRGTVDGATYTDVNAQLPGHQPAHPHRPRRRRAVPAQHPPQGLGAPGDRRRHLGVRGRRRRRHRARPRCSGSGSSRPSRRASASTSSATSPPPAQALGLDEVEERALRGQRRRSPAPTSPPTPTIVRNIRLWDTGVARRHLPGRCRAPGRLPDQRRRRRPLRDRRRAHPGDDRARELDSRRACPRPRGRRATSPSPTATAWWCRRPTRRTPNGRPDPRRVRRPARTTRLDAGHRASPASTSARASAATSIVNTEPRRDRLPGATTATGVHRRTTARTASASARSSAGRPSPCASATSTRCSPATCATTAGSSPTRDVRERVRALAPFLDFDADPYPVVVDGRIKWIIDAYTTTEPLPVRAAGAWSTASTDSDLDHRFNYVRNSVKAVVDAYDGTVTFYVIDDDRPDHPGLPAGVPRPVHRRGRRPRSSSPTSATRRTCSGCRPTCGAATTSTTPTTSTTASAAWTVARDPGAGRRPGVADHDRPRPTPTPRRPSTDRIEPVLPADARCRGRTASRSCMLRPFMPDPGRRPARAHRLPRRVERPGDLRAAHELRDAAEQPGRRPAHRRRHHPAPSNRCRRTRPSCAARARARTCQFGNLVFVPIEQGIVYVQPLYITAEGRTSRCCGR